MHGTNPDRRRTTNRDPLGPAGGGPAGAATPAARASTETEAYEALRDTVDDETVPATTSPRTAAAFDEPYSDATTTGAGRPRSVRRP